MTAVGLFAGRGDIILAMGLAVVVGLWLGWYLRGMRERLRGSWQRFRNRRRNED